jgi:hypothetical protein
MLGVEITIASSAIKAPRFASVVAQHCCAGRQITVKPGLQPPGVSIDTEADDAARALGLSPPSSSICSRWNARFTGRAIARVGIR